MANAKDDNDAACCCVLPDCARVERDRGREELASIVRVHDLNGNRNMDTIGTYLCLWLGDLVTYQLTAMIIYHAH